MKVYIPRKIGFCFGVRHAIEMVKDELKKGNREIYCLGDLIHNPQVMKELSEKGVKVILSLSQVKRGTVFTRAHGIDREFLEEGRRRGLKIVETTCPYVMRVQRITRELATRSYHIVIVGSAEHPEVKAVISNTPTKKLSVIKEEKEIERIPRVEKIGVVAQTTESLDNFKNIVKNLIKDRLEIRVFNTLCKVVIDRQEETKQLAEKVEAMVVVGGSQSSNTQKLAEICRSSRAKTYLVEKLEDINFNEIKKLKSAGITGGTSTSEAIIKDIKKRLLNHEIRF
ncbi:4-hydroxy-3-methylbut-2-enyl diphosphate reductase [Candidatus Aerophobetes bacterium]|nr:4-hydroxy-3-methylbut-2-enyl diphosphate reductase [Candidatus Aerophobetes bacterium]